VPRRPRFAACALVGALALTACSGESAVSEDPSSPQLKTLDTGADGLIEVQDRTPVPELSGTTLDGEPLDVSAMRGQVVVLNFWASWCAPCRAEADTLNEVATRTADQGVRFVGINVKDELGSAQAFERKQEVGYPSLFDQPGRLLLRFRKAIPQTPPTTLIVDREGRIAAFFAGAVRLSDLLGPVEQIAAESV
jgi:thiol-disulfide isomerase/thioredoxin